MSPFETITRITCFSWCELCLETSRIYIYFFLAYQTIRAIVTLFFSFCFQSSFSDGWFIPSQLYLFIYNRFNFCYSLSIFFYFFMIQCEFYRVLKTFAIFFIDGIYYCFFCFFSKQENSYMIHYDLDSFYDIFNTITEHNLRQNHYLSSILNYFDIYI